MPSGSTDEADFLRAGANDVVEKPVSGAELKKVIAKAMMIARTISQPTANMTNNAITTRAATGSAPRNGSMRQPRLSVSGTRVGPEPSVHMPARASVRFAVGRVTSAVTGRPASAFASRSGSLAPAMRADAAFTTDVVDVLGWERLVSYTLDFTDPKFKTPDMRWAFIEYRRSGLNHKLVVVLFLVSVVVLATRGSVATLWWLNPAFAAAFASYAAGVLCVVVTYVNRLAVISHRYDIKLLQPYHEAALAFAVSHFADAFENCGVVFTSLSVSLYLFARVLQGSCPPGTVLSEQQCNPEGSNGEVPQESLVFAVVAIISFQLFANGASKGAVLAAWVVLVAFVNMSMYLVGSSLFLWNNLLLVFAACVSYEFERWVACGW
jgi:CheY-like chemotaxis protein